MSASSLTSPGDPSSLVEPDAERDYRLPRDLVWLYLIGPLCVAPLKIDDLFSLTLNDAARKIVPLYLPFLSIAAACHALYAGPLPHRIARIHRRGARFLAHATTVTVAAIAVGSLVRPILGAIDGGMEPLSDWLASCVVITGTFMLPTLIVQDLRARAASVERIARAARQAALEAQLQAIQARTNPHFFFNSINTVASLIPDDPALAERVLERLADVMRFSLESSGRRTVTLERELKIVRDYLEVHVARFGDRLRWSIDLDPTVARVEVPPLMVQPLVENAVLHGVSNRPEGGTVYVRAAACGDGVRIEVSDDGLGPGGSAHRGSRTSIEDLRRRLALLYGAAGQLESGAGPDGGFRVRIEIPRTPVSP